MQTTSKQILKNNQNENLKGGFNMFKTMNKRIKNEKGLTLIELLAVIVILAIVAAIAVPAIGNIIENSRVKAAKADIANVVNAANLYFTENPTVTKFIVGTELGNDAGGTAITETDDADQYVAELGTIKNITITKPATGALQVTSVTGSIGDKTYSVTPGVTISELKIDKGNEADDKFLIGGVE